MAERVQVREIDDGKGSSAAADSATRHRFGGDLASGADGAAVGAAYERGEDRRGDVHQRGPGAGRYSQVQRRRVRLAVSEVRRWPAAHVQPARTPGNQEDREVQ